MPDHLYVRASQIGYAAVIDCEACNACYEVREGAYNDHPCLVRRADADRHWEAVEERNVRRTEVMAADAVAGLRQRIEAAVDGQPSMAARHRVLSRIGLAREVIGTYRKRPYGGAEALRYAGAEVLARIGSMAEFGKGDRPLFEAWAGELEALAAKVLKLEPEPIKTGATWLRA